MTLRYLALAVVFAAAAFAADVNGKWAAEFDTQIGPQKYTYDFKVDGATLTGKIKGGPAERANESDLKEGKVSGDEVSFVEIFKFEDNEVRIEYKGKLVGDEIKFTRKVGDFATEELVAKRVK
ncbi:hypothetical protein [uncultured Paludibaculum sp.]|uniref:hypothetical protein n=1 Tax=uncultured Paludibaculum sp. TaxID=1765020 RepID=UPI002AAACC6D|nr:hypothetical protein [uncultured Paludibaculum sp.]